MTAVGALEAVTSLMKVSYEPRRRRLRASSPAVSYWTAMTDSSSAERTLMSGEKSQVTLVPPVTVQFV